MSPNSVPDDCKESLESGPMGTNVSLLKPVEITEEVKLPSGVAAIRTLYIL